MTNLQHINGSQLFASAYWWSICAGIYPHSAKLGLEGELPFMNFGYMDSIHGDDTLSLDPKVEPHRSCIQLYHHVVCPVDIENKKILEVGCGHGGGALYLTIKMKPCSFMGIDFSPIAIDFCNQLKNCVTFSTTRILN